ncbi:zinc-dependent metalloprotease [Dyadobacter sp. CY323]|uniref:zinc-dependent metalloprotease n=1 Tax=Dyadobacter sp. CY323 TaxID=2907302 RepID=UPI001F1E62CF|nr:T9SS type A sorting domain-containing protein [Dyadobacter sp. CY323]MCE6992939.1 M12 family metallo-peptidase [Dyadobacter sp. CY323]
MNGLTFTSTGSKFVLILLLSCTFAFSQEKPFMCGTKDHDAPQEVMRLMRRLPAIMSQQNARTTAGELRLCRIAVDIDSDTYVKYQRDTAAIIQIVTENIEKASKFFEREANIRMMVTSIRIFKDDGPDPYAGQSDIYALLNILANSAADLNFDKKLYLYTKPLTGEFAGLAFLGGSYNVSTLENVKIIMHEIAHNFGAMHSNSCEWPGGPIDFCGGVEGGDCYDKSFEISTTKSLLSSCGGNVVETPLHPMIQAVIKAHAEANFAKMESSPMPVSLAGDITAIKGDFYAWPASISAKSYEFSYSTEVNFAGEIIEPTPFNGVRLMTQTLGTNYFVRVRAINSLGTSAWSNTVKIRIDADRPDLPLILGPASGSISASQQAVTLSFSTVPGATAYRIQVTPLYDFDFSDPTDEIIVQNEFVYTPYLGGYKWRVKAIQGGKTGRWSETGYFSANPQLNVIGLFLPIPENGLNVPRTLPLSYLPNQIYPNVTVTIADNPGFNNPLFRRNYTPLVEIVDVFKDLPANTKLYLRVQGRTNDLLNYPDRDVMDYIVEFTTGSSNSPGGLTFLSEKNQLVFGRMNPKIAVSKEHIWLGVIDAGFIKMDQKALTYQTFNRDNTDGLLGVGVDNAVRTDDELNVHVLNFGKPGTFRKVKLVNEVPSPDALVTQIVTASNIQGYSPQYTVFWTQHVVFKETPSGPVMLRQLSDSEYIRDIRFYNNKAWILLNNNSPVYHNEILVMDLGNPNLTYTINSTTSPAVSRFIDQVEIQNDGKIWLRQIDSDSYLSTIAYYNGSGWSVFNAGNAPFGSQVTGLGISPSGKAYILASGNETQVYRFTDTKWEKVGATLPFRNFGGDLWIDKNESFWISNRYGLSRLASEAALPVTLVNFTAAAEGDVVALHWEVTDQVDMDKYVAEHSTDAKTFRALGETPAMDTAFYTLTHYNPSPGINYYRLKSIETDADFAYSKVIAVNLTNAGDMVFYPNPVTDQLRVKVRPDLIGQSGRIKIFAADGKWVFGKKIGRFREQEQIDVSNLAAGNYWIRIENKAEVSSKLVHVVH